MIALFTACLLSLFVWADKLFPPQFVLFFLMGLVGMLGHYLKQRYTDNVPVGLWNYVCRDQPSRTLAAILSMVAASFAAAAIPGFVDTALPTLIAGGFTSGYTLDSLVNKGDRRPPC